MIMADLTAIIITKNEEKNIEHCIRSVMQIAKRIIVVDSFSEDKTVELAKNLGAETYLHEFINHGKQFLYGLNETGVNTRWVLRIDADERLTEASAREIEELCNENTDTDVNGLILRFEVEFMGKQLRHGGIYPFRKLLVFKYGIGTIEERNMDEHIILLQGRAVELKHDSKHCDYKDLTYWVNKHNWYAGKEVLDYVENLNKLNEDGSHLDKEAGIKRFIKFHIYYKLPMGMRSHFYYLYRYYIKAGFLDGKEGQIFAFLQAYWYRFLVDAKIYEWQKSQKTERDQNNQSGGILK